MYQEDKYFNMLSEDELWQRYCGFFDLTLSQFKEAQEDLLMQQVDLVAKSSLGQKLMGSYKPNTLEEFRQSVPLTNYEDYEPYLSECQENCLAVEPLFWCHSAGRGGNFKWIPYTPEAVEKFHGLYIAYIILAAANYKGQVRIKPGERILLNLAARPYASGFLFHYLSQAFTIRSIPPQEQAENLSFQERIEQGFKISLRTGVDEIFSISSVLVKLGERMAEQTGKMKFNSSMLHPLTLATMLKALFKSKREGRQILPKDLWNSKAIIAVGMDTAIYKKDIAYYWGQTPFEIYASTEAPGIAVQNWNKKWLTLIPYTAFWEFIPEEENVKSRENKEFQPGTVLIDELEVGKIYEVVLTQFYGMPLLRYRIGDKIQVVALADDDAGVNLPQIVFHSRIGDTIDLAGLARLTERVIWQAIVNTGIKFEEWCALKEFGKDNTFLHLYIELKEDVLAVKLEQLIDEQLKEIDPDYRDIHSHLGIRPVKVTTLPTGTFGRYYQEKVKEGADLAHLKPPHMNASKAIMEQLLRLSG